MDYKQEYQRLKQEAENAYNQWSATQNAEDWEWFMQLETRAAGFAHDNEREIWDDCGDYSISIE